jgi:hypothetical protein
MWEGRQARALSILFSEALISSEADVQSNGDLSEETE